MSFWGKKFPFLVPDTDSEVCFVVTDAVAHQGSVIAFGSTLHCSCVEVVCALALGATYHLAVATVPIQGIIGASILLDTVGTLAIPCKISVVAIKSSITVASDDNAIVGTQKVVIEASFRGGGHRYVLRLVLAIVEVGVDVPSPILEFGGDDGEIACGCQGSL